MKLALASLIAAGSTLAACAPTAPGVAGAPGYGVNAAASERQCFRSQDIRNHTIADDHTLYIDVGGRDVYGIGMTGSCLAGAFPTDPIITRQPPGSAMICGPIDMDISIGHSQGFTTPCIVGSIQKLKPEEVAALPPKLRP